MAVEPACGANNKNSGGIRCFYYFIFFSNDTIKLMVQVIKKNGTDYYKCEEGGFHYADKEWAEKCETWCREHHSCNLEITAQAEENKT